VTNQTLHLFEALNIKINFLRTDPSTWETNKEFPSGKKTVGSLKVVNDVAERHLCKKLTENNKLLIFNIYIFITIGTYIFKMH